VLPTGSGAWVPALVAKWLASACSQAGSTQPPLNLENAAKPSRVASLVVLWVVSVGVQAEI
jgi:hypothetical protein